MAGWFYRMADWNYRMAEWVCRMGFCFNRAVRAFQRADDGFGEVVETGGRAVVQARESGPAAKVGETMTWRLHWRSTVNRFSSPSAMQAYLQAWQQAGSLAIHSCASN